MNGRSSQEFRFVHLDMVRGIAALLVCLQHLRHLYFVDYSVIEPKPSILGKIFYAATGQGPNAVMIFFVLSGFFIAGSVLTDHERGSWSWLRFAIRRLSRLYVVLIPALVLTLLWDSLAKALAPGADTGLHTFYTFGASLLFLETIFAPAFGTNSPLWSVAYEGWYYLMFPLLFTAVATRGMTMGRVVCLVLFLICVGILPQRVLLGGCIWLMGYGAFVLFRHRDWQSVASSWAVFFLGLAVLVASVYLGSKAKAAAMNQGLIGTTWHDLPTGLGFALMVPFLAKHQPGVRWYRMISVGLSDISYTLYTVHFPVVIFLSAVVIGAKTVPSPMGFVHFTGCLVMILLYATVIWWLFEARTNAVRKFLERRLLRPRGAGH